jgi:EAL domain-containing protein (putative c-di-GMP-specific phosphodiesterase class I)
LLKNVIDAGHAQRRLIAAEGVESAEERDVLVQLGVDLLQGYLLGLPDAGFPTAAW